ncbi:MAG: hypothetical protein PHT02_00125 [Tissierellia bacterium]|nr:hypothetical protein [Tissierellia bacterium]
MAKTEKFNSGNKPQVEVKRYKCSCCPEEYKDQEKNFYKSSSLTMRGNNGRMVVCKKCVLELFALLLNKYEDCKTALYYLCQLLDVYFDANLYPSVEVQATNSNSNIAAIYFQKINSLNQYSSKTFVDSTLIAQCGENSLINKTNQNLEFNEEDLRNKEDVIRMVGYDPFENENPLDKKGLYNSIVDMLDESTLEDSFKLPIVIEIAKSFNQIDKINQALAIMTSDVTNVANQVGGVKSLFEAKDKMYRAILAMAKDNGISVNHATNKSKGAGTLSGIMKQLQEKGFMEAEVNLFDIETCEGMSQVADISNKSILKQLQFDENDYVAMITDQRNMIQELNTKTIKLEEENRLLKINIKKEM